MGVQVHVWPHPAFYMDTRNWKSGLEHRVQHPAYTLTYPPISPALSLASDAFAACHFRLGRSPATRYPSPTIATLATAGIPPPAFCVTSSARVGKDMRSG